MKTLTLFLLTASLLCAASANATIWRDGANLPANSLGSNGDYYLHATTGAVYKKNNGVYAVVANLKGAAGNTGATGEAGANGSNVPDPAGHDNEFLVVLNGVLVYSKSAPPAPTVTFSSEVTAGKNATLTVSTVGVPPFAYQWSKDGVTIGGATGAALVFPAVALTDSGTYICTVTNPVGATTTRPAVLAVKP